MTGVCETPASENLFLSNDNAEKLDPERKQAFHSGVQSVLYLS